MSLLDVGEQITLYGGLFILIIGVIGNGINVLVFSTFRNYRTTPCTFYFLFASISNIIYIPINLITRIVITGFGFDLTGISTSWCKMHEFCLVTFTVITLTYSCLATIDQFFVTSRSVKLRGLSSIKWAHRIVIIVIIVWCLHGIPLVLYYNISPITMTCVNTNAEYVSYTPIYLLGVVCGIPVLIMVTFGYLTYRNIRLTRVLAEQQADRQLAKMTLIQVILLVICMVPYSIFIVYNLITYGVTKGIDRLVIESFIITLLTLGTYLYFAGSCYMFLISSKRFRQATKQRIFFCFRPNQVITYQQGIGAASTLNNATKY